jgi:hypothetical protein
MVTKGGGSGAPSYRQVVVDRGKGRGGGGFQGPTNRGIWDLCQMCTERIGTRKEDKLERRIMRTKARMTDPTHPMGVGGNNACKPKMTMIPKVVLEDPQTQEYRDQMRVHALICKFMGLWPTEKIPTKLDQIPLETMQRGGPTPRIKRIFHSCLHESRGQRQGF